MYLRAGFAACLLLAGLVLGSDPALAQIDHADLRLLNVSPVRSTVKRAPIFDEMKRAYFRTQQFPEGSVEWLAARANYEQRQRDFDRERARGATVHADVPQAVAAYVEAYMNWMASDRSSAEGLWLEREFRIFRGEAVSLARSAEEPTPIARAFDLTVSYYGQYLDAPTASAAETVAVVAFEILRMSYYVKRKDGQRLYPDARAAAEAARRIEAELAQLPARSKPRKMAELRLEAARRERDDGNVAAR